MNAMRCYRIFRHAVLAASAGLLPAGVAHADTCADMDGDGIAETCVPSNGGNTNGDGNAPNYGEIRQQRYEAALDLNAYGVGQLERGDLDGAIASFKEALGYHGDDTIRRNLAFAEGLLAARNRDYGTALTKFRRAISLDPANAGPVRSAMESLGAQVHADAVRRFYAGDFAGALELFKLSAQLAPGIAVIPYNIAVTEAELAAAKGDFGKAAKKLGELDAKHPELSARAVADRRRLGDRAATAATAELESGDRNGAIKAYRSALALTPDNAVARGRLELLTTRPKGGGPWQVFYSGTAREMFGAQGRGSFASREECEAYIRSSQPFEQARSSCSGPPSVSLGEGDIADTGHGQSAGGQPGGALKPGTPPVDLARKPLPSLPWQPLDFVAPSKAAQSACLLGTTAAQNAFRRGELDYAARILRVAIPGCRGSSTRTLLTFRLLDIEGEIAIRAGRAGYVAVPSGLVGGTTWVFEDVARDLGEVPPEEREQADATLRSRLGEAGMDPDTFMAVKDYQFILGLAVSRYEGVDLVRRVVFDNDTEGEFTRQTREQYAYLKGKHFDVLDCHSNGAMICLAALRNGDVTARKVRLFGPQLSPEAITDWRRMLDKGGFGNKIDELQVVLSDGDPVPAASYLLAARFDDQGPAYRDTLLGRALDDKLREPACDFDGLLGCYALPEPQVIRLSCRGRYFRLSISECHPLTRYRKDLDAYETR